MSDFKISSSPITNEDAIAFVDELESAIGEVLNGERKAGRLPMETLVKLCQFARAAASKGA